MKQSPLIFRSIFLLLSAHLILCSKANAQSLAFPTAEGFGKYTKGGRGGVVMKVTNLNDDGPGSFREAATKKIPRIIVFDISGTIHLQSKLTIGANATIAGHTAPGDGICLADQSVGLGGDNIIVRFLRFRLGDQFQKGGMVDGNGGDDAFGGNKRKNIIIDHCSMSWSDDEVFSIYGGDSTTVQWNLIAEPLNYSYHFETGDKDYEKHGYGGIWGGAHLSAHHNLFAHCVSRNPRFNGARLGASEEFVDFNNNVIYNWQHNSVYGGEDGRYNMINNYYKPGPSTNASVVKRIVNPSVNETKGLGVFYVAGNIVDGNEAVSNANILGIEFDAKITSAQKEAAIAKQAFETLPIQIQDAKAAYFSVLNHVGASFKRDTLDERIIQDVVLKRGKIIDVQGNFPHGTAYELTKNAWPNLKTAPPLLDTDNDGMPDDWELKMKLDSKKGDDTLYTLSKMYTNIEMYLNSIVQ
jgi:pectate lyase